jgi:hypothetical protein
MRALSNRCDRHAGAADECGSDREQSREHEHHSLQNAARRIPGSCSIRTTSVRARIRPTQARCCPAGIQIGVGVRTAATYRITNQGNLAPTGNQYDVAINGKGYFTSPCPTARMPTRGPALSHCRPDGAKSSTSRGYVVAPGLAVPNDATSVTINAVGQVQVQQAGQNAPQTIGQIELAAFPERWRLAATGDNLFTETPASGTVITGLPGSPGYGTLQQGFLENLQCQCGAGDHRSDHRAARLRDELRRSSPPPTRCCKSPPR